MHLPVRFEGEVYKHLYQRCLKHMAIMNQPGTSTRKELTDLQKRETKDLQAISCYALLQVGKILPCRCARLFHHRHVFEEALVEMFVDLTFESGR